MITLTINGDSHNCDNETTLAQLLISMGIDPTKVAVERNLEIVPKSQFDRQAIKNNDNLEIVHFIGGG